MKKIGYILSTLLVGGLIVMLVVHAWQSTAFIQTHGRDGTLVIGERYEESHWATPLPLKKVYAYTATLAPHYQVVLQSDQELVPGHRYPIRFLARDKLPEAPSARLRPVPGAVRLRTPADPEPATENPTAPMDRLMNQAMGVNGTDETALSNPSATTPDIRGGAVPFLLGKRSDHLFALVWNNSRAIEWVALALLLLFFQALFNHARALPWFAGKSRADDKDFVHPSLRVIEADPTPKRSPIGFTPGAGRVEAPAPAPAPTPHAEPILKLPRK